MRAFGKILLGAGLAATMVASDAASARPWGYGGGWGHGYYGRGYYRGGCGGCGVLLGAGILGAVAIAASRPREIYVERSAPPPYPYDYPYEASPYDYPPPPPPVYDSQVYRDETPPPPPPPPAQRYYNDSASKGAVDSCKVAAEREGEKYSSKVRVDNVENVTSQNQGGYRVTGVVSIEKGGADRGRIEHSSFDCTSAGGRVVAFRFGSSSEFARGY